MSTRGERNGERLTDAIVRVDGREEGRANAVVIVLPVRYVRACAWVAELLSESEVDDVHARLGGVPRRHDEVGGLDVAVDKAARMYVFYPVEL